MIHQNLIGASLLVKRVGEQGVMLVVRNIINYEGII